MIRNWDWSVDVGVGHCAHRSGLEVVFDPNPSPTGAVFCTGPTSPPTFRGTASDVTTHLGKLTLLLEQRLADDEFLVWGARSLPVQSDAITISLLGTEYTFIPNIALRTELLLCSPPVVHLNLLREWSLSPSRQTVVHRLGFQIEADGKVSESCFKSFPGNSLPQGTSSRLRSVARLLFETLIALRNDGITLHSIANAPAATISDQLVVPESSPAV